MPDTVPLHHDIPSQLVRGRRARIAGVDPDDSHKVWVAFRGERGTPEPAYFAGDTPLTVGKDVRVTAEPELKRWQVHAEVAAATPIITLTDLWDFDTTTTSGYTNLEMHPNGLWVVTARIDSSPTLRVLEPSTQTVMDSEVLPGRAHWVAVSPDGLWVAVALQVSPYLKVYPINPSTGAIGAALSNPATLPTGPALHVQFDPRIPMNYVMIDSVTSAESLTMYNFRAQTLGARVLPEAATLVGWGFGPISDSAQLLVHTNLWTQASTFNNSLMGFAISPSGDSVVLIGEDEENIGFITQWALSPYNFNGPLFGLRTDESNPHATLQNTLWKPVFSPDGNVIVWHNIDDDSLVSGWQSNAYTTVHSGPNAASGVIRAMPLIGDLLGTSDDPGGPLRATLISSFGGNSWRPAVPGRERQLLTPVQPSMFAENDGQQEPRLILWHIDDAGGWHFRAEWTAEVYPTDEWDMNNQALSCWHPDGNIAYVYPAQSPLSPSHALATFSVT